MIKEKLERYLDDFQTPEEALGRWSCTRAYSVGLTPVGGRKRALQALVQEDVVRHATEAKAREALAAETQGRTAAQKLKWIELGLRAEAEERMPGSGKGEGWLHGAPAWFRVWRKYGCWLEETGKGGGFIESALPHAAPRTSHLVRLSFGKAGMGSVISDLKRSCVMILEIGGAYHVAVMLRPNKLDWDLLQDDSPVHPNLCRRWVPASLGYKWVNCNLDLVNSFVESGTLALFKLEEQPLLKALLDGTDAGEGYAMLVRTMRFYVEPKSGAYSMTYSVMYNPIKSHYEPCARNKVRTVEIMLERKVDWARRAVEVPGEGKRNKEKGKSEEEVSLDVLARRVVETNGFLLLPQGCSDELRIAAENALHYIVMPGKKPDEPGGLLRGYQMPGRILMHVEGQLRGSNFTEFSTVRMRKLAKEANAAAREVVADALFRRTVDAIMQRNPQAADVAGKLEEIGARETLIEAAWQVGIMDGNALALIRGSRAVGSLKLPDWSLAIGFEGALGLDGTGGRLRPLVQTDRVRALAETPGSARWWQARTFTLERLWTSHAAANDIVLESVRVVQHGGEWYLLAFPRLTKYQIERDLFGEDDVAKAWRFVSQSGTRSRADMALREEHLDWTKLTGLLEAGHIYLYRILGWDAMLAGVFGADNRAPCRVCAGVTGIDDPGRGRAPTMTLAITYNPQLKRDPKKVTCRSLGSYLTAYPEDAAKPQIEVRGAGCEVRSAARECVEKDGLLVVGDKTLEKAALEAMSYVVMPGTPPDAPGGALNGYQLQDRVFAPKGKAAVNGNQNKGKPLCEVASEERGKELLADLKRLVTEELKELGAKCEVRGAGCGDRSVPATVEREFKHIIYTGTMSGARQLVRPAHEIALGIWLASLPLGHYNQSHGLGRGELARLAEEHGIGRLTLYMRLKSGMPLEEALKRPLAKGGVWDE